MQFKDGDVIRWSYKSTAGMFEPYWCKSQFAIFKNGEFRDTYWYSLPDQHILILDHIEFRYLGNINDYRLTPGSYELDYYDDADILNLSHSNSAREFYVKKDAKKSVQKIRRKLEEELKKKRSSIDALNYDIESIKKKLENVTENTWI